jgi:hypothetical protein
MLRVARVCILDAANAVIWYCGMIWTCNVSFVGELFFLLRVNFKKIEKCGQFFGIFMNFSRYMSNLSTFIKNLL